ncbi:MAG: nitroreductase family protein, partial [bacterium]|nr:nitroreductase family protein [bacterium]
RYYAVTGDARTKLADVLMPGNHWALRAPLLFGVTRDSSIANTTESREYGMYDVALSVMCLAIEAEHQGLRTHQMAGFHDEAFRRVLGIKDQEAPVVMVAVGYEGNEEDLDAVTRAKEQHPRVRKPISEVVTMIHDTST